MMNETSMNEMTKKTSARTQATRGRLIASAEQLFAERGVASVSLNEITRAAQQKNRNAVHYHFGSKDALLQAIFEKHWQPIGALRRQMLEELEQGKTSLRDIVSALVLPVAARFEEPDGGVCYIKISAQLAASNLREFTRRSSNPGREADWGPDMNPLWRPFLSQLPPTVLAHRMSLMVSLLFHGLADHAAHCERGDKELANTPLMVSNLIDSICAMLSAPVSDQTRALTRP
jgi:AcrR family transcriptional regulator